MKFYIINKEHGTSYSVEAADIRDAVTKVTGEASPFMIVAREYVSDGEIYQAIQIKPDTVQINFKKGHRFVTADTIAEALTEEGETPVETRRVNTVTVYNGDNVVDSREFDVTNGDAVIDDWLESLIIQPEEGYELEGFATSKNGNALTKPIKAFQNRETTILYVVFRELTPTDEVTE